MWLVAGNVFGAMAPLGSGSERRGGEERRNAMWRRYTTTFFFQLLTRRYDKMDDMIGSYSLQTNEGYEEGASVATIPPHSSS